MPIERLEKWKAIGPKHFELQKARMCLVNWSELILSPAFRISAIEQVFDNPTPSLATLTKYGEERVTALLLARLIAHTSSFFKVGGAMDHANALETAYLIIDNYYWLSLADFKLCFQMGKAFQFGKLYDRFDGAIIMQWLDEYNNLRVKTSEQIRDKEHHHKIVEEENGWTADGIEAMKTLFQSIADKADAPKPISFKSTEEIEVERARQLEQMGLLCQDYEYMEGLNEEQAQKVEVIVLPSSE